MLYNGVESRIADAASDVHGRPRKPHLGHRRGAGGAAGGAPGPDESVTIAGEGHAAAHSHGENAAVACAVPFGAVVHRIVFNGIQTGKAATRRDLDGMTGVGSCDRDVTGPRLRRCCQSDPTGTQDRRGGKEFRRVLPSEQGSWSDGPGRGEFADRPRLAPTRLRRHHRPRQPRDTAFCSVVVSPSVVGAGAATRLTDS